MKVGIIIKPGIKGAVGVLEDMAQYLKRKGTEVIVDTHVLKDPDVMVTSRKDLVRQVDAVVVLGGDGTMLSACRLAGPAGVPVLGVNLGGLGFITETKINEWQEAIDRLLSGDYQVEERMMLEALLEGPEEESVRVHVLNDVVITKGALARIIDLEVLVDGTLINTYKADGLIISTPTGSTAYNLSAGGPIVHPQVPCIVVTPICPHTLTNRPIVLSDSEVISIRLISKTEDVFVTFDGQLGYAFTDSHHLTVRASEFRTKLILPRTRDFFSVLREKLNWGVR